MALSAHHAFEAFVALHIITGAPGLVGFWIPVATKKASPLHRRAGRVFIWLMLATASSAIVLSMLSLLAPLETHPHLEGHPQFGDAETIRGIFGWMMLYLAILTINLAWYGRLAIRNRLDHARNSAWHNVALQGILLMAATNCAVRGVMIGQPMMVGISLVGFATVATNLWFMWRKPGPVDWIREHIKALIGTGISVYTAFFAFGAVRLVPELALAPVLWAVPLIIGLWLIIHHRAKVAAPFKRRKVPAE
jgi:hypothetical protein